jgi:branched-chain amino acid transport system substrate-binding protein
MRHDAVLGIEGIRNAQEKFGKKPLTGEQVQWGLEHLHLNEARLKELGFEGMMLPVQITCADHEGARSARIQQWDGNAWKAFLAGIRQTKRWLIRLSRKYQPSTPQKGKLRRAIAQRRADKS